jgi:hypothetical protein
MGIEIGFNQNVGSPQEQVSNFWAKARRKPAEAAAPQGYTPAAEQSTAFVTDAVDHGGAPMAEAATAGARERNPRIWGDPKSPFRGGITFGRPAARPAPEPLVPLQNAADVAPTQSRGAAARGKIMGRSDATGIVNELFGRQAAQRVAPEVAPVVKAVPDAVTNGVKATIARLFK